METEREYEIIVKKKVPLLEVPNQDFEVIWEPVKGNYAFQRNKLRERGIQNMIISTQLAPFLGDVHENKNQEFSKGAIQIMNNFSFKSSTESLWLPKSIKEKSNEILKDFNNGVIGYDNPDTSILEFGIKESEILEKLNNAEKIYIKGHPVFISKDGSVRYTPFGFKKGAMSSSELVKNPYNIVLHGEEGAEKIAEISEYYNKKPLLWAYNFVKVKQRTRSSLRGYGCFGKRLSVDGCSSGGVDYSVGVLLKNNK